MSRGAANWPLITAVQDECGQRENAVRTVWSKLVSHRARRMHLWCFAVVFTAAIALRVEAAIFASRIVSVVNTLSTLRLGETSKAEALRRMPTLRPSETGPYGAPRCNADECFSGAWVTASQAACCGELGTRLSRTSCAGGVFVPKSSVSMSTSHRESLLCQLPVGAVGAGCACLNATSSS
jgi:hypothetical protein